MSSLEIQPETITVLDLDVTFNSGPVYACTIKPGDVLQETPEAITIRFGHGR